MSIKEGDMVSIRQDFIDEYHKHEYNSKDIWEVKEVYNIGGGYYVAIINNLTGYGDAHICTYNLKVIIYQFTPVHFDVSPLRLPPTTPRPLPSSPPVFC